MHVEVVEMLSGLLMNSLNSSLSIGVSKRAPNEAGPFVSGDDQTDMHFLCLQLHVSMQIQTAITCSKHHQTAVDIVIK